MKNSKKTEQILKKLDNMEEILYYYMLDTEAFKEMKADIAELREFVTEAGLEQKEYNARFAKKLKSIWDREHD